MQKPNHYNSNGKMTKKTTSSGSQQVAFSNRSTRYASTFETYPPLALYIHFPWCLKKCPYCDFNSHAVTETVDEQEYIDALINDLDAELPNVWGRSVQSIFMGGGTPSLFSADAINTLLNALRARLKILPDCEITMEANPGTLEASTLGQYQKAGVTRLSIGVQSLDNAMLKSLGRVHDADAAVQTIAAAKQAGFDSFNVDLMYGLPDQTVEQAQDDLQKIIDLAPPHISHYQLTIEPNTLFAVSPPVVASDDESWQMQINCQQMLAAAGYQQYEISAYAKPGFQCKHNLNYWLYGDYLGIGAGAHQKITLPAEQRVERKIKQKHPEQYKKAIQSASHCAKVNSVPTAELAFEFMLNALRLTEGFKADNFMQHTGLPLSSVQLQIDSAVERGWIIQSASHIYPTPEGQRFLNDLIALFLPDDVVHNEN